MPELNSDEMNEMAKAIIRLMYSFKPNVVSTAKVLSMVMAGVVDQLPEESQEKIINAMVATIRDRHNWGHGVELDTNVN